MASLDALNGLLLSQRGIDSGRHSAFFELQYDRDIHNPMLMFGMDRAVERIYKAIEAKENIVVHGDYDADGITSTAVLVSTLRDLGARVTPFLPHRMDDGYGLNLKVLKGLSAQLDLLITVDCGISNQRELKWLKKKGIDAIVSDHHSLPEELPEAVAVLHARHPQGKYPFKDLAGVGVAWKLAQALLRDKRSPVKNSNEYEKWLLDLVCLGTVADMVPVLGENRAIIKFGLQVLKRSRRVGVRALMEMAVKDGEIDEEVLSFRVLPALNSAGRLDHAQPALDLLLTYSEHEAGDLVDLLRRFNQQRSTISRRIQTEAEEQIGDNDQPVIFAADKRWQVGVVGLVANRLSEKFGRPAVVVGGGSGHAIGSIRSPLGMSALKLIAAQEKHLIKYGGHECAAGFSVEYTALDILKESILDKVDKFIDKDKDVEEYADAVVKSDLLNWDMVEMLEKFAPYGEGNKRPRFIVKHLPLVDWRAVGKKQEHVKFTWRNGEDVMEGIGFGLASLSWLKSFKRDDLVDVLFNLEINEFRGRRMLQLMVRDAAPSGEVRIVTNKL